MISKVLLGLSILGTAEVSTDLNNSFKPQRTITEYMEACSQYKCKQLDLSPNQWKKGYFNVYKIKDLESLEELNLTHVVFSKLKELEALKNLRELDISYTTVKDINVLSKLPQLQHLNLQGTKIKDLSALKHLNGLETLLVSHYTLDLTPLNNMSSLKSLDISGNLSSDLDFLSTLENIKTLNLKNTRLSNIDILKNLESLEFLDITNTEVSDISPLLTLPNLKTLKFENTKISSIALPKKEKKYTEIAITPLCNIH